jgi:hypothetical protein
MPLTNGYGVVIGTIHRHFIEEPDEEGRWPHYHIEVDTPAGIYECVINLKSRTETRIEYRDYRNLDPAGFTGILALADGFHPLPTTNASGALDFARHPALQDPCSRFWLESGVNAIELMQYYLINVARVFVFGEPYEIGRGVHNVHCNQGDPPSAPQAPENAIWQDGGVLYQYAAAQPRLSVFLTKFESQSLDTDDDGHPLP